MQTQRDHVQAYAFQAGRLSSAVLTGEASFLEPPARRTKLGLLVGIGLTVLIAVGFLVFGLIQGSSSDDSSSTTTATSTASPTVAVATPTVRTTDGQNQKKHKKQGSQGTQDADATDAGGKNTDSNSGENAGDGSSTVAAAPGAVGEQDASMPEGTAGADLEGTS